MLAYYYRCAYFTNLASVLPAAPALATALLVGRRGYDDGSFTSDYGLARGLFAPSEAGPVFQSWFARGRVPGDRIRRTASRIGAAMGGPFVWKNLNLSFHLPAVHHVFPDALFVQIRRDLAFNCQSILVGLRDRDVGGVPGVMARGTAVEEAFESTVAGVVGVERTIGRFFAESGCASVVVDYHALCADPAAALGRIEAAYAATGAALDRRRPHEHARIPLSETVKLPPAEWARLQAALAAHAGASE
jgi:hypothetical protein